MMVDEAIAHVGDRSLTAEVMRWRGLQKKMKAAQESIRQIEDRLFAMAVDQRACRATWRKRGQYIGSKKRCGETGE
jgi:hypothetical protein